MKRTLIIFLLMLRAIYSFGQSYVTIIYDVDHLAIVNENAAVRLASEFSHNRMLSQIRQHVEDINLNIASLALVQRMVLRSMSEVDQALKSGRSVILIAELVVDIQNHSSQMISTVKEEPWLLLVAEKIAKNIKERSLALASEVSSFILNDEKSILMDFEKRDHLMRKIILELKVIRAMVFSMQRSMYWAKVNGLWRTFNPYQTFINKDKQKAEEILRQIKMLRK